MSALVKVPVIMFKISLVVIVRPTMQRLVEDVMYVSQGDMTMSVRYAE